MKFYRPPPSSHTVPIHKMIISWGLCILATSTENFFYQASQGIYSIKYEMRLSRAFTFLKANILKLIGGNS